jgi:hypothetical protein
MRCLGFNSSSLSLNLCSQAKVLVLLLMVLLLCVLIEVLLVDIFFLGRNAQIVGDELIESTDSKRHGDVLMQTLETYHRNFDPLFRLRQRLNRLYPLHKHPTGASGM